MYVRTVHIVYTYKERETKVHEKWYIGEYDDYNINGGS